MPAIGKPLNNGAPMDFPTLTDAQRIERLVPPTGRSRIVLDTDTYNEIDDQFAVVYAMLAREQLDVAAITAAPFYNNRSTGPGDGMTKSHEEILRVLERLDILPDGLVFRGATQFMAAADQPVESEAARRIVELAMASDDLLYVLPIGAITNVASALLIEPRILEKIVIVWLGGHPTNFETAEEFNLKQDMHASRLVFDSGVPLVQIPCRNVAEHLRTCQGEVHQWVKGRGPIGDYLAEIYDDFFSDHYARSKVIWDISTIAWMLNANWVPTKLTHSPILTDQCTWSHNPHRHLIREAVYCDRDQIFKDLFVRIENASKK